MELGEGLRQRLEQLSGSAAGLADRLMAIAQGATLRAVEEAMEHTPPNGDGKDRGAGMITGELAQSWAADSQIVPEAVGGEYHTSLINNVQYASYVNDGHRMDRHFVPGLIINPDTGLLERTDPAKGGIVVGTKSAYVSGVYMKEKGIDKYKEVAEAELNRLAQEVFE